MHAILSNVGHRESPIIFLLVAGLAVLTSAGFAMAGQVRQVSSCNTTLARGESAILVADLDCAPGETAIRLSRGVVRLNGHHISGARHAIDGGESGTVTLLGPGEIAGNGDAIITGRNLKIEDVTVRDNQAGMYVFGSLRAHNLVVVDSADFGINVDGKVTGDGITSSRNHIGIKAERAMSGRHVVVTDNRGTGLAVLEGSLRLSDSTIAGNATAEEGWDILSPRLPRLVDTACGTSISLLDDGSLGAPWGVCADD